MAQVGIIMGSDSDMPVMKEAIAILEGFDIQFEVDIVSAHRTPEKLFDYGSKAHQRGLKVIINLDCLHTHFRDMFRSVACLLLINHLLLP